MPRVVRTGTIAVVLVALLGACSSGGSNPGAAFSGAAVVGSASTLHGAEAYYGASPVQQGPITYQPDVVFLGGGASSIKSVTDDGLIWTIDGHASHAHDLKAGDVLFASSFGAGRVLGIETDGNDERVALGPVALTDIIKDGTFSTDKPVALTGFSSYATPTQPGLQTDTAHQNALVTPDPLTGALAAARRAGAARASTLANLPFPVPNVPDSLVGDWHLQSVCCTSIGLHVGYDKDGAPVEGTASMQFEKPSVSFKLSISKGTVVNASVKLNGAASLTFSIIGAVIKSANDFKGGRIQVPVDIAIPIPIGNLPVTIGVQQLFSVGLGLEGVAKLSTSGEYALGGSLGFSVVNNVPTVDKPTLTTTKSALDAMDSIAVSPTAIDFAYAIKLSIGVGPPGLSAGIWYQVAAALAFANSGTQLDKLQGNSLVACKTVALDVTGRYGVGYQIPSIVADAVNFFLKAVMKNPLAPLAAVGGPSWGPTTLYHQSTPPYSK